MKMPRRPLKLAASAVLVLLAGCGSNGATAPTTITVSPSPKITAPAAQSPVNGQLLRDLTTTLAAGSASVDIPTYVLQYRVQVVNDAGSQPEDSVLNRAATWTTTNTLTRSKWFMRNRRTDS